MIKLKILPSHQRVLALLTEPKSVPALRETLGISRQGVDQLLKPLLTAGLIARFEIPRERGRFLYVVKDSHRRHSRRNTDTELHPARAELLSVLSSGKVSRLADMTSKHITTRTTRSLKRLATQGLVVVFELGRYRYVSITAKGLQHPQYDPTCPKAPAADIVSDFGQARVWYLQFLLNLGSAKSRDLAALMPTGYFHNETWKSGQIIQRLQLEDLIEEVATDQRKHPRYRLTKKGQLMAEMLSRAAPIPSTQIAKKHAPRAANAD
jgi:predicted transcriptional regulator